jgi:hypothetical protein
MIFAVEDWQIEQNSDQFAHLVEIEVKGA